MVTGAGGVVTGGGGVVSGGGGGVIGGTTVNWSALLPAELTTCTEPLTAVAGTVAVMSVADNAVIVAATVPPPPANVTVVDVVKFAPWSTTELPAGAEVGVTLTRVGAGVATGGTIVRGTLHRPATSDPLQKLNCSMLRSVSVPSVRAPRTWATDTTSPVIRTS